MTENNVLGLESGMVRLVPYDPRWSELFRIAAAELEAALGSSILAVHHVGSTSVPGLCAKPLLDILVSVADLARAIELVPSLAMLGYEFRPNEDIPDRHFFRRIENGSRTHHLSLAEPASGYHIATLKFRDALRASPELAGQYGELKKELASQFPHDRQAYIEGKTGFVQQVLAGTRARLRKLTPQ